jgi:hypothetical protein
VVLIAVKMARCLRFGARGRLDLDLRASERWLNTLTTLTIAPSGSRLRLAASDAMWRLES